MLKQLFCLSHIWVNDGELFEARKEYESVHYYFEGFFDVTYQIYIQPQKCFKCNKKKLIEYKKMVNATRNGFVVK